MNRPVETGTMVDLAKQGGEGGVLGAWITMTEPLVVEAFAQAGFQAATFDAQHGLLDEASLRTGIERAGLIGLPALVRLPVDGCALASRVLDWGATGVVLPMVETAQDAARLVAATKYPPLGMRSFGPQRAATLHGYASPADYHRDANNRVLALAMIETRSAFKDLDAIVACEGLDGVFVGPSDLSIALSSDGRRDLDSVSVREAIAAIGKVCRDAGRIAAIYASTPKEAKSYRGLGFGLVFVGSDAGMITAAAHELRQQCLEP